MVDEQNLKAAENETTARPRDRVGHFVDEVREKAGPALGSARDKIVEQAHVAKEKLQAGAENLKKKSLNDLGTDAGRYVRSNPGKVVLGAFAVGLIAGILLRGRDRG